MKFTLNNLEFNESQISSQEILEFLNNHISEIKFKTVRIDGKCDNCSEEDDEYSYSDVCNIYIIFNDDDSLTWTLDRHEADDLEGEGIMLEISYCSDCESSWCVNFDDM